MQVLNEHQINQKVKRLAIEILEHNYQEKEIILAGINNNGLNFAKILLQRLEAISEIKFTLTRIRLNPAKPIKEPVELEIPAEDVYGKVIIIIDDVANTGRTIWYAARPLMNTLPKKVEVAVLVDRQHKSFPVKVDYMGLSLATTLKENIDVQLQEVNGSGVFLN